jgi:hypothetical protein
MFNQVHGILLKAESTTDIGIYNLQLWKFIRYLTIKYITST